LILFAGVSERDLGTIGGKKKKISKPTITTTISNSKNVNPFRVFMVMSFLLIDFLCAANSHGPFRAIMWKLSRAQNDGAGAYGGVQALKVCTSYTIWKGKAFSQAEKGRININ
jgi:hypothetical protein